MTENIEKIVVDHNHYGSCGCGSNSCCGKDGVDMAAMMSMLQNKQMDPSALMAMANQNGMGGQGMWWILLILLLGGDGLFGKRNGQAGTALNEDANTNLLMQAVQGNKNAIESLASTVNSNEGTNVLMRAIEGNQAAVRDLGIMLNTDQNRISESLCDIRGGIDRVAGVVGTSSQNVIAEMRLGNCNIAQQLAECCCNTRTAILEQTNALQKDICQSTFATQTGITNVGNIIQQGQCRIENGILHAQNNIGNAIAQGFAATNNQSQQGFAGINYALANGFSSVGFETQRQTQALLENANSNTQKILSQMCNDRTQDLRDKLFEMSQSAQTAQILSKIGNRCGCVDNCGCCYPYPPITATTTV